MYTHNFQNSIHASPYYGCWFITQSDPTLQRKSSNLLHDYLTRHTSKFFWVDSQEKLSCLLTLNFFASDNKDEHTDPFTLHCPLFIKSWRRWLRVEQLSHFMIWHEYFHLLRRMIDLSETMTRTLSNCRELDDLK